MMMKRYTALLLLLYIALSSSLLQAQRIAAPILRNTDPPPGPAHPAGPVAHPRTDPIWTDDFSDPSNWSIGTLDSTNDNWVVGTAGPAGDYAIPPILSTTAPNGFALFDSDLMCDTDNGYIATAHSIDLSAYPHVQLQFEQFYRRSEGHTFVDVSNDSISWTPFEVNTQLITGQYTANPELFTLNISSVAASQPTVWFRFRYVGNCDYAWMVDDVALVEQPDHDLSMVSVATTSWNFNTALTYDSVYYGAFTTTELRPRAVNMTFFNSGYLPATNVVAHITTSDGYDESGSLGTVAPGDSVTWFGPLWTPSTSLGDHFVYYSLASDDTDADTTNNAGTAKIKVSDYFYARDDGARTGEVGGGELGDGFLVGNWMHAQADETLYDVQVAFSSGSAVNVEVNAQLLDTSLDVIAEAGYYTLTTWDLSPLGSGHFVPFCFGTPVQLTAGSDYLVMLQHFGGANVLVATSGLSEPQSSMLFRSSDSTWYSISTTPMVRMDFSGYGFCFGGIDEVDGYGMGGLRQNAPNPADVRTQIEVNLKRTMQTNLALYDINGKRVRLLEAGRMSPGSHLVDVNTTELDAGVYFYSLTTSSGVITKRMTVMH